LLDCLTVFAFIVKRFLPLHERPRKQQADKILDKESTIGPSWVAGIYSDQTIRRGAQGGLRNYLVKECRTRVVNPPWGKEPKWSYSTVPYNVMIAIKEGARGSKAPRSINVLNRLWNIPLNHCLFPQLPRGDFDKKLWSRLLKPSKAPCTEAADESDGIISNNIATVETGTGRHFQ
jgi:hypothetical protein